MKANIKDVSIIESIFQIKNICKEAVENFFFHFIMYICEENVLFHMNILSEIIIDKKVLHIDCFAIEKKEKKDIGILDKFTLQLKNKSGFNRKVVSIYKMYKTNKKPEKNKNKITLNYCNYFQVLYMYNILRGQLLEIKKFFLFTIIYYSNKIKTCSNTLNMPVSSIHLYVV